MLFDAATAPSKLVETLRAAGGAPKLVADPASLPKAVKNASELAGARAAVTAAFGGGEKAPTLSEPTLAAVGAGRGAPSAAAVDTIGAFLLMPARNAMLGVVGDKSHVHGL